MSLDTHFYRTVPPTHFPPAEGFTLREDVFSKRIVASTPQRIHRRDGGSILGNLPVAHRHAKPRADLGGRGPAYADRAMRYRPRPRRSQPAVARAVLPQPQGRQSQRQDRNAAG